MKSINKVFLILLVGILLYPASFVFADTPIPTITSMLPDTPAEFDNDFITKEHNLTFTGNGPANTELKISFAGDNVPSSGLSKHVTTDENGDWTVSFENHYFFDGNYTVYANIYNTGTESFDNGIDFTVDSVAPSDPIITGFTADSVVTIDSKTGLLLTEDNTLIFKGTADPDTFVHFWGGYSGGTYPNVGCNTKSDSYGNWTCDHTQNPLPNGNYQVTTAGYDLAGNISIQDHLVNTFTFTVDARPKIIGMTNDTGISNSDWITSDNEPTFTGTANPNTNITLTIINSCGVLPPNAACANWVIGTTTSDNNGNWSIKSSLIRNGEWEVVAFTYYHDNAYSTDSKILVIDTTAPDPIDIASPLSGVYSGSFPIVVTGTCTPGFSFVIKYSEQGGEVICPADGNFTTKLTDTQLPVTFSAIQIDIAGNIISNDYTLTAPVATPPSGGINPPVITSPTNGFYGGKIETLDFIGTCDYGNTVKIVSLDPKMLSPYNRLLSNTYEAPCQSNNTFLIKIESDLVDQNNNVISLPLEVFAIQFDGKGNVSKTSAGVNISSTETIPTISTLLPYKGDYQRSPSDIINFFGTSTPNTNVRVTIDNSCPNLTPGTSCALWTVGETISDSNGNWSLKTNSIIDGIWEFNAIEYNNIGSIMSGKLIVVVHKLEAPVIISPLSGPYSGGNTYTVTGTCDATVDHLNFTYESMQESDGPASKIGNNFSADTPCAPDGTFTQTFPSEFNVYPFKFAVVQIDTAGNMSPVSNIITLEAPVVTPPSGGGGGGGNPTVCTRVMGDINCDEKVDKYDFSLMMMVWGYKTKDNADLNTDLSIDKYDFALLMTNWGYGVKGSGMAIIKH